MISLTTQVQIITFGIIYGFICSVVYSFFNNIFYKKIITRLILEVPMFIGLMLVYFYAMIKINDGKLNIYQPLWLAIGCYIYLKYYNCYFLPFFVKQLKKIYKKMFLPFKNKYAIIKKKLAKKVKRHGKKRTTTPNKMESKQSGQHFTTWNFPDSNRI